MGLRELLILILILAIVGVILRGLYVALRARRGQLRMQLDKNIPQYDPEELVRSELPNGGARMVERSFAQVLQQNSEFSSNERRKASKSDHAIPVLMDTISDDDEDDELSAPRQSSVASARDAARQKHLLGQRGAPIVQKPVHRPIDRMAAAVQNNPISTSAPVTLQDTRDAVHQIDEHDNDDDYYDDPLDRHVFSSQPDDIEETEEETPYQDADDFDDDADADDFDDSYDDEDDDDFDESPSEQSVDADDDFEDEDDDLEDEEDEDFDDFDDADEPAAENDDHEDDLYEKKSYDDHESWEEEDDAEDEEVSLQAEEFDAVYSDPDEDDEPHTADNYTDDDDGWDDDSEVEQEAEESGPRRWLKWAGNKLSGMGASTEEPVRERDFHGGDRAEPVLGLEGIDEELSSPRTTKPTPETRIPKASLDKSRQAQLFFEEEPIEDEEDEFEHNAVASEYADEEPAPAPLRTEAPQTNANNAESTVAQDYSEVLVINVVAKPDREFYGVDLLQALLGSGMRFGDMNIFHRHFDQDPSSPVLFSVANMVNPGTFDLNRINDFATRGVCFFMTLPNVANSMQAFDRMLDVAQQLRIALDGDLKDDNRSVMTAQTIEHYRQRVRDFDLRQMRQPK